MAASDSAEEKKRKRNLLAAEEMAREQRYKDMEDLYSRGNKMRNDQGDRQRRAETDYNRAMDSRAIDQKNPGDQAARAVMNLFTKKPKPRQGPGF
jgi:hypothetical protein